MPISSGSPCYMESSTALLMVITHMRITQNVLLSPKYLRDILLNF